MEEQFDAQQLLIRVSQVARELRKSDAFPAIVGGIAGGIAGALMAGIIAGRVASRTSDGAEHSAKTSRGGWSAKDLAQLIGVLVPLVKQAQQFFKEQKK